MRLSIRATRGLEIDRLVRICFKQRQVSIKGSSFLMGMVFAVLRLSGDSRFAGLVVDVVFGFFRSPVLVSQLFQSLEFILRVPKPCPSMRVASCWEPTLVFRQVHLIAENVHFLPPFALVLEPSVGYALCQYKGLPDRSPQEDGLVGHPKGRFPSDSLRFP